MEADFNCRWRACQIQCLPCAVGKQPAIPFKSNKIWRECVNDDDDDDKDEVYEIFVEFWSNIFQDCIQPFGHEMLSWVRLRGINAHSVSPPAC